VAKRISPHALRHTYALRALRHTGNVMAVAKLLGHAQLSTTQRYVDHLDLSELRQAVPPLPARVRYSEIIYNAASDARIRVLAEREDSGQLALESDPAIKHD